MCLFRGKTKFPEGKILTAPLFITFFVSFPTHFRFICNKKTDTMSQL